MPSERLSRWHLTAMDISLSDYFSKSATALYTTSPSTMFSPALSAASSSHAFCHPLSASAITYLSVALVKAKVEVLGTAPGMLATQ